LSESLLFPRSFQTIPQVLVISIIAADDVGYVSSFDMEASFFSDYPSHSVQVWVTVNHSPNLEFADLPSVIFLKEIEIIPSKGRMPFLVPGYLTKSTPLSTLFSIRI